MGKNTEQQIVKKSIEQRAEDFKDLLIALGENNTEASSENSLNRFCAMMWKDPTLWEQWLDFALETISRLSAASEKNKANKVARLVVAALPTIPQRFPAKKMIKKQDYEYWMQQMRQLNLQFIIFAKMLMAMLLQHGELSISRQALDALDESIIQTKYLPDTDTIRVGTRSQARKWTLADEMEANLELKEAQQKKFEKESGKSFETLKGEGIAVAEKEAPFDEKHIDDEPLECEGDSCTMGWGSTGLRPQKDPTRLDQID
jgi:hypothetical protein